MMQTEPANRVDAAASPVEIARLGLYALYCLAGDYYQLVGPDAQYSRAWLQHHLPAGDWSTEWSGFGERLVVHITR